VLASLTTNGVHAALLLLLSSNRLLLLLLLACLQDLDKLQSVSAAKPWHQGCLPLLRFMFSTRAAIAAAPPAT
jgi:hypothetical protein